MAGEFVWIFFNALYFHTKEWLVKHGHSASNELKRVLGMLIHVVNPALYQKQLPTDLDGDHVATMIYGMQETVENEAPKLWSKLIDDVRTFTYYEAAQVPMAASLSVQRTATAAATTEPAPSVPEPDAAAAATPTPVQQPEPEQAEDVSDDEELILPFTKRARGSSAQHPIVLDEDDDSEVEEVVEIADDEPQHEVEELPDLPGVDIVGVDYSSDDEDQPVVPLASVNAQQVVRVVGSGATNNTTSEAAAAAAALSGAPSTPVNRGIRRACPGAPVQPRVFVYQIILRRRGSNNNNNKKK